MSIIRELKASFSPSYLSIRDSEEILLDLIAELSNHNKLELIMEELSSYTYKGKKQKITRIISEELSNGIQVEDSFLKYGLIENDEYMLLKRALSTQEGLEHIITFRKEGSQFFVFLSKVFLPLYLFVLFGISSFLITSPMLKNFLNTEVAPIVSMKKNYDVEFDLPVFIEDESIMQITLFFYLMISFLVVYIFKKYRKENIRVLYKLTNILFYDDFIKYMTIASSMKKSIGTSDQIFEDLSNQSEVGLKPTFTDLYERGSDFYESFQQLNAPYRIVSQLRRNEENSKFWENLDNTIEYVKKLRADRINFFTKYFSKIIFLLGFLIFMFCLMLPVVYFILNIYAFAM